MLSPVKRLKTQKLLSPVGLLAGYINTNKKGGMNSIWFGDDDDDSFDISSSSLRGQLVSDFYPLSSSQKMLWTLCGRCIKYSLLFYPLQKCEQEKGIAGVCFLKQLCCLQFIQNMTFFRLHYVKRRLHPSHNWGELSDYKVNESESNGNLE